MPLHRQPRYKLLLAHNVPLALSYPPICHGRISKFVLRLLVYDGPFGEHTRKVNASQFAGKRIGPA